MRLSAGCSRICKRVEGEAPVDCDDEFAIDDELVRRDVAQQRDHLGEIPPEGLTDFARRSTAFPDLKARQRKPSHFGSNCQGPRRQPRGARLHGRGSSGSRNPAAPSVDARAPARSARLRWCPDLMPRAFLPSRLIAS